MRLKPTVPLDNLLSQDGLAYYYGPVFSTDEADRYFHRLLETIDWKNDEVFIFGKKIITKRKVGWYGDEGISYTYSRVTKKALPWTPELLELKAVAEEITGETYNSCLLNLYHNGEEGMGWHADDEKELKKDGAICSLSFGAPRKFIFKNKQTKNTLSILLEHGSLLLMKGPTQTHWQHRLPPVKSVTAPRINLTFRTIAEY